MNTEKEALQRVQGALYHLRRGLAPFVEARMKARHGAQWAVYASRAVGGDPRGALDEYALLKTMIDNWGDAFGEAFDRRERHRVRNFVSTALEARNATSHLSIPLQDHEALRYLDAIHEVLRAVKAPAAETAEAKRRYDEQRQSGIASAPASPSATPTPPAPEPATTAKGKALRPWIEVALPHPDVLENRFKQAEFAADLFAVDSGNAEGDYATPRGFFGITFLTEGLKRVLSSALQRLAGQGGDPVIGLQTAFGGGKTHTLLSLYHLARHMAEGGDPSDLPGLAPLVAGLGGLSWEKPQLAAFVGSSKGTDVSLTLSHGPKVRTLWGYLAWRLAGNAGLALVAEAEAARTNPGSELMVEVFRLAGASVILLDELVMFARQLDDVRFEAFLSFIQSLTEAAKMVPGVIVVGSLPESGPEAGGARGLEALLRLEKVFGRVQSAWLPASGNETYEIVRRRLFQPLDADGERAREDTVKAFAEMYRRNAAEFPPEAKDLRYTELLRLSYPIHPELFDRLSRDWSSLEKFQRTRDVLRFMANVVGVLWQERVPDPLILPARVPVAHERVRTSVLYPLDPAFASVVDTEVDGYGSLPQRLEANPSRRISQARAATRAARAVFLCSAPLVGQSNAGLTEQGLRLACAEPGDQLAIFGEALRELSEGATYLHEQGGRYWFSTQATLKQLADGLARALPAHEVDEAVVDLLREDAKVKSGFFRVFGAPDDPTAIDEAEAMSLVILGPATPHAGRGPGKSEATSAATDTLMRCRSGQRHNKNNLLFVAGDTAQLATARDAMRRALAWEMIGGDPRQNKQVDKRLQDQMTQAQLADARERAKTPVRVRRARFAPPGAMCCSRSKPWNPENPSTSIICQLPRASAAACRPPYTKRRAPRVTPSSRRPSAATPWRPALRSFGRRIGHICRWPRSPAGFRLMSICQSCETGLFWRMRSARLLPSSIRNSPTPTGSTRLQANTPACSGRKRRWARSQHQRCWRGRILRWRSCARTCLLNPARMACRDRLAMVPGCRRQNPRSRPRTGPAASMALSRSTWSGR